jgi:hypothetical protein
VVIARRRISPDREGGYRVRLPRAEREVLAALPTQLRDAIAADEPSLYRLFPPAFVDDAAANVEYHALVGEQLVDGRLQALAELERTAHADRLTDDELRCWLGAVESLRLVLGTQLDVTDDTYVVGIDRHDPDAPRHALYHYLSWLQEEIVAALAAALPERSDDDGGSGSTDV